MLGIKIRNTFISLYPDTALTFEMNHPIGIITDALDQVQGGYSFPVDIPLDEINRGVIGHVDRLDHATVLMQDEYCEVWAEGLLLHIGKVTIKKSSPRRASLFMVFEFVRALSDVYLTSLDLGGDRDIGADDATRLAHADDTLSDPLDHDYIFAPIYNKGFLVHYDQDIEGFDTEPWLFHQNYWTKSGDGGSFVLNTFGPVMPFVRLDYLLTQIFAYHGYTLDNQWQITDELKQLLVWNNYNISVFDGLGDSHIDQVINLRNHVPYRNSLDMLKALLATYALGLFPDPHDMVMSIIPFKTLITNPVEDDWTDRAAADYGYDTDRNFIARWRYDLDEADAMSLQYSGAPFPQNIVSGSGLTARIMYAASQFLVRYSICDNSYYNILYIPGPGFNADYLAQDFKEVKKTGSDKEYISPLIPLWNTNDIDRDGQPNDSLPIQEKQLAAINHPGFNQESYYLSTKAPVLNMRLFFYRGMQPYDTGISGTYPMTGITRYNIRGEQIGDYALTWDQTGGVYDAWWKLPYEMLADKKDVTRQLNLSIRDLVNFRFYHKYRIENQNYFITRLRYTLRPQGLGLTECTMMTTL